MSWIVHISKICIDCIRINPNNVEFAFNDNDPVLPVDSPSNGLVMRGFDVLLVVNRNKFFNKKIGLLMISDAMVHIWGHCKDNPKYLNSCINMFKYRVSWNILITLWWILQVDWISMADMLRVFVTSSILRQIYHDAMTLLWWQFIPIHTSVKKDKSICTMMLKEKNKTSMLRSFLKINYKLYNHGEISVFPVGKWNSCARYRWTSLPYNPTLLKTQTLSSLNMCLLLILLDVIITDVLRFSFQHDISTLLYSFIFHNMYILQHNPITYSRSSINNL